MSLAVPRRLEAIPIGLAKLAIFFYEVNDFSTILSNLRDRIRRYFACLKIESWRDYSGYYLDR